MARMAGSRAGAKPGGVMAAGLIAQDQAPTAIQRGGRKAHPLEMERAARETG